jgi:hypothetical protein
MPDLIFFFDGGGRWVLALAVTLILAAVALWLTFDKRRSPMWEDEDDD